MAFPTPLLGGVVLGSHSEVVCAAGASLVVVPYTGIKFPSYNGGFQSGRCSLWWCWVRGQSVGWNERRNGENKPQLSLWFIFRTYRQGLPLLGSPLAFLIPLFLRQASRKSSIKKTAHIPLERGGVGASHPRF